MQADRPLPDPYGEPGPFPGPWKILDYGTVFLVRRHVGPHHVQYILNEQGKEKVFRKKANALAAIAKTTGAPT